MDRVVWYTFQAKFTRDDGKTAEHACGEETETFRWRPKPRVSTVAETAAAGRVMHEDEAVDEKADVTGVLEGGDLDVKLYGPFEVRPGPGSCVEENIADEALSLIHI